MAETLSDFSLGKTMQQKGSIQKVGVIGAGSAAQEIIRFVSKAGLEVIFINDNQESVQKTLAAIDTRLDEQINRWGLTPGDKRAILSRIIGSDDYAQLKTCDIVIEATSSEVESILEARRTAFRKAEEVVDTDTVITTNTSTLNISDIASVLEHPERALGLHFVLPLDQVKVVEVVRFIRTNEESYERANRFVKMLSKEMVEVQESPGNISTRMMMSLINEACSILLEGVATVSEIDATMKHVTGLQTGPFEMADNMGLHKVEIWMNNLYAEFGDIKYKPSPIIKRLVRAGMKGRVAGEGFYSYADGKRNPKSGNIQFLGR